MSEKNVGVIQLITAMALSGTIGVFVIESHQTPINVVFFRCLFGGLSLLTYCGIRGFLKAKYFNPKTLALMLAGGIAIVFNWFFLFRSYSLTSITVATVVYHVQPFFVLFLGAAYFREKIPGFKIFWVVVAFCGLILVSQLFSDQTQVSGLFLEGVGSSLLAAFLYAIATLIAKSLKGTPPHLIALVQTLFGTILLFPLTRLHEVSGIGPHWFWLVGLGLIHTCFMYILLYSSFQKLPLPLIAVLTFIYPVVAMLCDHYVYGKNIDVIQGLGVLMIFSSSLCMTLNINPFREFLKKSKLQLKAEQEG